MKYLLLIIISISFSFTSLAQPAEIKRIMAKQKANEELTEQEEATFEKWLDDMTDQADTKPKMGKANTSQNGGYNAQCPPLKTAPLQIAALSRDGYTALAKGLLTSYGPKTGDLPGLKSLLQASEKPTDGADIGALFKIQGAGSASVYALAYSAAQKPDDILTANNLGVALKDMGDFAKSLQVLKYADKLKPNIGLVICNMGWTYREMGYPNEAKAMFEKAIKVAPEMTNPFLGLGLIAKCEGNFAKAEEYLRKALADNYSAVGFAAYKQAKAAQPQNSGGNQGQPLANEKGNAGQVEVPEMPLSEQKEKTAAQKEAVQNYMTRIDSRMQGLLKEYNSALSVVRKQQERAMKNPDNSMVFRRDFAMELMQFQDVTELLFGENSNYGAAFRNGIQRLSQNSTFLEKNLSGIMQYLDKTNRLQEQLNGYMEDLIACGDNKICIAKVEAQIDAVKYEMDQVAYEVCVLQKGDMDNTYSATCKTYKEVYAAFKEAVPDYYAFTNPFLERIYSPSFNELMNLHRQMLILTTEKIVVGMGAGLPDIAEKYNELKCVEPNPPDPPGAQPQDSKLPKKKEKDCPLGKGINHGFGAISFELDCEHVKLSGGEGILWSVSRDFNKHETKMGLGVGAKGEYGNGNLSGEATIMVEVTVGQGDVIKDVALTSTVKTGLGGLVAGEISGRLSLQGGPSVDANAGFITPDFPGMGE